MERQRDTETGRQRQVLRERVLMSKKELIFPLMILTLEVTQHHLDQMLLINAVICLSED